MKPFVKLFVVAVVSCLMIGTFGQECEPSTCPPGPVTVLFQYSNCTGDRQFASIASSLTPCSESGGLSEIVFADTTGYWSYTGINNPTCDLTQANLSYSQRQGSVFGTCIPFALVKRGDLSRFPFHLTRDSKAAMADFGTMLLPSVNATFESPQEPQVLGNPKNLTSIDSVTDQKECYSTNNCTKSDGSSPDVIGTFLDQAGNCSSGYASAYIDGIVGACYYKGDDMYASLQCNGPHGYDEVTYVDDNCVRAIQYQGVLSNCLSTESDTNFFCTSPTSPVTPPPPSDSDASVLSIGPIAIISAIFLALVC